MANFKKVNAEIKKQFPEIEVEVIRGDGYIYFGGEHYGRIDSIMAHPVSTSTEDVIRMAAEEIKDAGIC